MADHWKSLAQKLGAPGMDAPESAPTEVAPAFESSKSESVAPPAPPQPMVAAATPPAAEEAPAPTKPRKRSSWETLANMFNIQFDREPAPPAPEPVKPAPIPAPPVRAEVAAEPPRREEPRVEEARHEPRRDDSRRGHRRDQRGREDARRDDIKREEPKRLSVFDEDQSAKSNPALEALFPDAPREDFASWKRTPRMVDDVGWDDDAPVSTTKADDFEEVVDEAPAPKNAEDAEETGGRRRRRRRGSRRSRGDTIEPTLPARDPLLDDLDAEPIDTWAEPDSFEVTSSEDEVEAVDPERRSSRRRRRGRRRPREESLTSGESSDVTEPVRDDDVRPAERSDERSVERRPPRTSGRNAERRSERSEEPRRDGRSERSSEGRSSEGRSERPPRVREERPLPRVAAADDDLDELEEDGIEEGEKHRNIPSWTDSLQSIIEANMENHKRNDNRGGPPRGRPRSRR